MTSLTGNPPPPRERRTLALRIVVTLNALFCRIWYRLRRVGPCTVPAAGPVILAANHTCSADPLMISAACPYRTVSFLVAREFVDIPVARWFIRLIQCIPVRRDEADAAATKTAIRRLRQGGALGIFVEGRIVPPGQHVPPKDGAAVLALRTGAVVIPVRLSGNHYRESILRGLFALHRARLRFGPPVNLGDLAGRTSPAEVAAATQRIYQAIEVLDPARSAAVAPRPADLPPPANRPA